MTSLSRNEALNTLLNSNDFKVSDYLNHALSSNNGEDLNEERNDVEQQRRMAELALQLQVQTHSCHDEIGRIGAELRAILPRCDADLGRLHMGLNGMKEDASSLLHVHLRSILDTASHQSQAQANDVGDKQNENSGDLIQCENNEDSDTNSSEIRQEPIKTMKPLETLETLSTLHALRTNLTQTKAILTAASSWDKTLSKIPSYLSGTTTSANSNSSSSLSDAVAALATLEAGAKALRGMPNHSERIERIVQLRNQILVLLKPQLLHSLQRIDTRLGPLQQCVGMYASLNQVHCVTEEYVKSRPTLVHKLWFAFRATSSSGVSNNKRPEGKGPESGEELEFYSAPKSSNTEDNNVFDLTTKTVDDAGESSRVTDAMPQAFLDWLPSWYEAVLALLNEERRRVLSVFGSELAPEIIIRILNECFRPVLSSFSSRLSTIYSHDNDETNKNSDGEPISSSGSLGSISAAYEATLQFLSVAYEQIIESLPSLSSSSADSGITQSHAKSKAKTYPELYIMARSTLMTIGSPFAPYQKKFAKLEKIHSGLAGKTIAKDIQNAVTCDSNRKSGILSMLQDSVESLTCLATFMFPLADTAMARFESFNSGYWTNEALSTVDSFLSSHIAEISIAFDTLAFNLFPEVSANEKRDTESNANANFDEQQVQCALEVLRVAGVVQRDMKSFEEKTRDRLRILCGRMNAAIDEEYALKEAVTKNENNLSLVPDSLSAGELEAILARAVFSVGNDLRESNSSSSLQYLESIDDCVDCLFPKSVDASIRVVRSCQTFVFDVCGAIPLRNLNDMASFAVWGEEPSRWETSNSDSYGTLPQTYITQIGEHMLAMVQALEPFAQNEEALHLANLAMETVKVDHVAYQIWNDFVSASNCPENDELFVSKLMNGDVLADYLITNTSQHNIDEEEDDGEYNSSAGAIFCNQWLNILCSAVTGRLLERTVRIHSISSKGCEHLSADFNYLVNVFSALGVTGHPHPLLSHVAEVVKMNPDTLLGRIRSNTDIDSAIHETIRSIDIKFALMRGISIN